jgi:hypothetical protein
MPGKDAVLRQVPFRPHHKTYRLRSAGYWLLFRVERSTAESHMDSDVEQATTRFWPGHH